MDIVRKRLTMQAATFEKLCAMAAEEGISVSLMLDRILADLLAQESQDEQAS